MQGHVGFNGPLLNEFWCDGHLNRCGEGRGGDVAILLKVEKESPWVAFRNLSVAVQFVEGFIGLLVRAKVTAPVLVKNVLLFLLHSPSVG